MSKFGFRVLFFLFYDSYDNDKIWGPDTSYSQLFLISKSKWKWTFFQLIWETLDSNGWKSPRFTNSPMIFHDVQNFLFILSVKKN